MEQWKVVPGYEGRYEASDMGRIRRVKGKGCDNGKVRYLSVRLESKYLRVRLVKDGKIFNAGLANLVAAAFIGSCPEGLELNHIDMDKMNNHPSNFEYLTHAENVAKARAEKPNWARRGVDVHKSHLTEDDVRAIRGSTEPQRVVGERYGISGVAVHCIRTRKTWKHIP